MSSADRHRGDDAPCDECDDGARTAAPRCRRVGSQRRSAREVMGDE